MSIPMSREAVKSDCEWEFVLWLQEAVREQLIVSWDYEPESFELFPAQTVTEVVKMKTKTKKVERHLHQSASYTPDFVIQLTEKGGGLLYKQFKLSMLSGDGTRLWVDVKGAYNKNDQPRYFSVIQKAVYFIHHFWVQKVIPEKLFEQTWCPEKLRWMKNRKTPTLTARGRKYKTVSEFVALGQDKKKGDNEDNKN